MVVRLWVLCYYPDVVVADGGATGIGSGTGGGGVAAAGAGCVDVEFGWRALTHYVVSLMKPYYYNRRLYD